MTSILTNSPFLSLSTLLRRGFLLATSPILLAVAACGGGSKQSSVQPGGGNPPVLSISPAQVELGAGATQLFAASIDGAATVDVSWTLASGPGTLTPEGLYSAPATIDNDASAVVRAQANTGARGLGEATVRLRVAPVGGLEGLATAAAYTAPDRISQLRRRQSQQAFMWWAEAGTLSGQGGLVTFGTIRAVGGPVLVYEPQPTDRLVVALLDGSRREFYYLGANGNLAAPGLFFETDYDLDVRVVVVMDYDLRFVSQRRGVDLVHQMTGTISVADNSFEVDLNANERIVSDLAGDYRTQDTVRGALRAPGIDVQVQDDGEFRSVSAPRPVNPRTVTTFRRLSASSFTVNGSRFEFRGADLYRILANDQPIEPDSWVARGELLRQGAVVGRIDRAFAGATLIAQLLLGGQVFDLLRVSF